MMLTRLQQRTSVATLKRTPMIWAANQSANFSTHDARMTRVNRGVFLATPRRVFSSAPEDGKQTDTEKGLSDKEQVQEMREVEAEPALEALAEQEIAESLSGEEGSIEGFETQVEAEAGVEEASETPKVVYRNYDVVNLEMQTRNAHIDYEMDVAIRQTEIDILHDAHQVLKGLNSESFSDLEGAIAKESTRGQVDILKQLMTAPDYAAREEYLGKASPKKETSAIQEQREQAMHKLAAFNKSADILKLVKQKMGDDTHLKGYLVKELKASGSDFGSFVADEITMGQRTPKETLQHAKKYLTSKAEAEEAAARQKRSMPIDHYSLGTANLHGVHAFAPSNPQDRLPKHDKSQIQTFDEYRTYLEKIGLSTEMLAMQKLENQLEDLYSRYQVEEKDREYGFINQYTFEDPRYERHQKRWDVLINRIPELRVMMTAPTVQDEIRQEFYKSLNRIDAENVAMNKARAPIIERQLQELKPKFEQQAKGLSESVREAAWQDIVAVAQAPVESSNLQEQMQSMLEARINVSDSMADLPGYGQSAKQIMQDKRYQKVNDQVGPLSIDRVTLDGPRDLVGEAQQMLKAGPLFDTTKPPNTESGQVLDEELKVTSQANIHMTEKNPVEHYLNNMNDLRGHLEANYEYAKRIEGAIEAQRRKVASDMLAVQDRLSSVQTKKNQLKQQIESTHASRVEQQVLPGQQLFDFIKFQEDGVGSKQVLRNELSQLLEKRNLLDPASTDTKAYEDELKVLSSHALLNEALGKKNDQLDHFSYVLDQLSINKVRPTVQIEARCFEYAVLGNDMRAANDLITKLTNDRSETLSPIDPRYLRKFFLQCLRQDQLDGVAYLVNYCARYGVDTRNFPVNSFRSVLDHHLNRNFDLSKVMIFLKFYQRHIADRARHQFDQVDPSQEELSDSTLLALSNSIFGQGEGLVDMAALTDHLVDQVGARQVIDPLTKQDSLWGLIESQSLDKDFIRVAQMSEYNGISGQTVAKYLGNQLGRASSFDRIFKTALRVQETPMADTFFTELIQHLNKYALSNGNQLPRSFTSQRLSDLYIKIKLSGSELSPGMNELLLFCLNAKGMTKEILDVCNGQKSDIHRYHLAESLFAGNIHGKTYTDALIASQAFNDADLSACQLTQRTKALFLDGNDQGAIDYFRSELAKRENMAKERKDLIVALYDNVMATSDDQKLTFDQFKGKHQASALFTKRLLQQAFAVSTLDKIVRGNDYDGIDNAFNLYMVLQQELELSQIGSKMTLQQQTQMKQIVQRKAELLKKVHAEDYQRLSELIQVAGDQQLADVEGLDPKALNHLLGLFQEMTFAEVKQVVKSASSDKSGSGKRKGSKKQKQTHSKEAQTMSIDEILGVHDEQSTWFQNFLDRKTELYEKSWSDVINENSQNKLRDQLAQIRKDNGDKGVPKPGELANRELIDAYMKGEIPADADIGKLRNNFRKAIEKTMRDLSKSYQSDSWIEQNVVLDFDDQVVENAIEKFGNYVPLLEEAYDEMKEELLEVKSKLYANRQVLAHEAKQTRFPTPKGKLSAEARNEMLIYARSIALYRLQATEMQDRLQELQGQVRARKFPDEGAQKLHETLYAGVEPLSSKPKESGVHRQLQEHFAVEVPMNLSSSILPDTEACRKIEQAAMRDALLEFNKDDQNALDQILADVNEPDSTLNMPNTKKSFLNVPKKQTGSVEKEQKDTTDAPWQAELERVESKAIETAHQHYYMGGLFPVAGKGDEKHPRELLEEIMEGLERKADDEDLIKKLYASQGFGVTVDSTSEEESDQVSTEEENEREEIEMEQLILDEMEGYKALILKSPMEYFMRMRVKEAMQNLRVNQITEREGAMESEEDWKTLKAYNDRVRHNDVRPDDNSDPINYHRHAHDLSILELKEGLTKAVSQRKAQALPLAISIFNRIQDKIVKTTRLDHDSESKDVSEDLHKLDILLNDQSSPLMSTLRSCGKYVHEKLPETLDAYRSTVKDGDILDQPVDLNRMINDYRALNKSEDTVKSMEAQLSAIELRLQAESKQLEHKTMKQAYDSWLKKSKQGVEAAKDSYLKKLYDDYLIQDSNISDATKVHLMQDVFRVEVGENFINSDANKSDSTFPVFFAHDLVKFGIRKQMPAAVRLGELILAEHCSGDAKMPEELARAVKEYMFEHQEQYQAAAKYTGPISATQIYHQARQSGTGEQPVFMTMDDPYWVKFQKENYRREDNWRLPSVHAWEHKPYGILGEVLDLKRFEKTMHEQQSKM